MNKIGFTCGAMDLLHAGHVLSLKDAKNQCDTLVVGLHTDPTTDRPHKNKPVQTLEERYIQLKACRYVDIILVYDTEEDLLHILQTLKPDIRILGSDYKGKPFTGDTLKIPIYFHERNHNYSSTELRNRL